MNNRRKPREGQVALENLLVYAIIIITILVGLVILWQMGLFNPPIGKKGYVGFSQVVPADWIVSSDENKVYLRLKNEAESDVIIPAYGVNITMGRVKCKLGPDEGIGLPMGGSRILMIYCDNSPSISQEYYVGGYFEGDVAISYTNLLTNKNHESIGRLYGVVEGYVPVNGNGTTSTVTTSSLVTTTCPQLNCTHPGYVNDTECNYTGCAYCRKSFECSVTGTCGQNCSAQEQCVDESGFQNPCPYCNLTIGKCEELPDDCGKDCEPGMNQCQERCQRCYTFWDDNSGSYKHKCEENKDCGDQCELSWFETYQECHERCVWCNTTTSRCDQGDCGDYCTDDFSCERGCIWCNMTTHSCEKGDCGNPCTADNAQEVCRLGCDDCQNGRCTNYPIVVTINARNTSEDTAEPPGGDHFEENKTIYLHVLANADKGVQQMIASRGVETPDGVCGTLAHDVETKNHDLILDPWVNASEIPWFDRSEAYNCNLTNTCMHIWTTNETRSGTYCYYAIAQENINLGGSWSPIASDSVQIGYLKVILAFPRPV